MPVVLEVRGLRFGFYASDAAEPPHVHVKKDGKQAKYWLEPAVTLEHNSRYRPHELNEIEKLCVQHRDYLLERWHEFFHG